ncbi:SIR2 family protein [Aeromonas hydrophila]|uniref:SIR2 family protein n=1 Tax=Aeromonas hydrophila TaxID=644 RepID=UPI003D2138F2
MTIDEAIEYAISGEAILFLGAGFSRDAISLTGETIPDAITLANKLSSEAYPLEPPTNNLMQASEDYIESFGEQDLTFKLKKHFTVEHNSINTGDIFDCTWKRIYTTNYDNLIECKLHHHKKVFTSLCLSDYPSSMIPNAINVIHINGFIDKLNARDLKSTFKLTESSYIAETFESSDWKIVFQSDLRSSKAIIFIGYSLYDIDISRILSDNLELKNKTIFITHELAPRRDIRKQENFGTVYPISLNGFTSLLSSKLAIYKIKTPKSNYQGVIEYVKPTPSKSNDVIDVHNLLMFGTLSLDRLAFSAESKDNDYVALRCQVLELERLLLNKGTVVIHSRIANGKNVFIEQAKYHLHSLGYDIFDKKIGHELSTDDINLILTKKKPIIFIKNYTKELACLRTIQAFNHDKILLVLTARSNLHDIYSADLSCIITDYSDVDINKLRRNEISHIADIIFKSGLIGVHYSHNKEDIESIISIKCHGELSSILTYILNSPEVKSRFDMLIEKSCETPSIEKFLAISSIAKLLSIELDYFDYDTIIPGFKYSEKSVRSNEFTRQLVSTDESTRSTHTYNSIVSGLVLKFISSKNEVSFKNLLVSVYQQLEKNKNYEKKYYEMARELNIYSNINRFFGSKDSKIILDYYSEISELLNNNGEPHFWLQFAIASINNRDYPLATSHMETAYSIADDREKYYQKKGQQYTYNRSWLNNQYARLILSEISDSYLHADCLDKIKIAHQMLLNENNLHYPFKVAEEYFRIYKVADKKNDNIIMSHLILCISEISAKARMQYNKRMGNHDKTLAFIHKADVFLTSNGVKQSLDIK